MRKAFRSALAPRPHYAYLRRWLI